MEVIFPAVLLAELGRRPSSPTDVSDHLGDSACQLQQLGRHRPRIRATSTRRIGRGVLSGRTAQASAAIRYLPLNP